MALGFVGKSQYGHQVSQVYCDVCATERIYPMLHETLYRVGDSQVMLCELHAILARRRPPTPGFQLALEKAMQKAREARAIRLADDTKTPRTGGTGKDIRISDTEQQSGGAENREDKQNSCME